MILYLDRLGRITEINRAGLKFSGFSRKDILGREFWKIPGAFSRKNLKNYMKVFKNSLKGEKTEKFTGEVTDSRGNVHSMEFSVYPLKKGKQVEKILVIANDFTERGEILKELGGLNKKYASIIEKSPVGIVIMDGRGVLEECNSLALELMGCEDKDCKGRKFLETASFFPKDLKKFTEQLPVLLKGENPGPVRFRARRNGDIVWIEGQGSLLKIDNKTSFIQLILRDFTECKREREKNIYQASLIENISDAIISTDINFNIKTWNHGAEVTYGWKRGRVTGKNMNKVLSTEYYDGDNRTLVKHLLKVDYWEGDLVQKREGGKKIKIFSSASAIRDERGNALGFVFVNREITKRKEEEEELKKTKERFHVLADATFDLIFIHDKGKIIATNHNCPKILGYQISEVTGKNILDFASEESGEALRKNLAEDQDRPCEIVMKRKNGTKFNGEIIGKPYPYQDKMVRVASIRDITWKKKAEEELRKSEEKYKKLVEESPDSITTVSREGVVTSCNEAAEKMIGHPKEKLIGKKISELEFIKKEDLARYLRIFSNIIKGKESGPIEVRFVKNSGETGTAETKFGVVRENGKITEIQAISRDVTDKKVYEENLMQKNRELEKFNKIAVNRELKMIQLKKKIKELKGRKPRKRRVK